jgi:hypothetical protein
MRAVSSAGNDVLPVQYGLSKARIIAERPVRACSGSGLPGWARGARARARAQRKAAQARARGTLIPCAPLASPALAAPAGSPRRPGSAPPGRPETTSMGHSCRSGGIDVPLTPFGPCSGAGAREAPVAGGKQRESSGAWYAHPAGTPAAAVTAPPGHDRHYRRHDQNSTSSSWLTLNVLTCMR